MTENNAGSPGVWIHDVGGAKYYFNYASTVDAFAYGRQQALIMMGVTSPASVCGYCGRRRLRATLIVADVERRYD